MTFLSHTNTTWHNIRIEWSKCMIDTIHVDSVNPLSNLFLSIIIEEDTLQLKHFITPSLQSITASCVPFQRCEEIITLSSYAVLPLYIRLHRNVTNGLFSHCFAKSS